jgi:hypothetical protein
MYVYSFTIITTNVKEVDITLKVIEVQFKKKNHKKYK